MPHECSAARQARCETAAGGQTLPPPSWRSAQSTLGNHSAYNPRGGAGVEDLNSKRVAARSCLARLPKEGPLHIIHLKQIYLKCCSNDSCVVLCLNGKMVLRPFSSTPPYPGSKSELVHVKTLGRISRTQAQWETDGGSALRVLSAVCRSWLELLSG